MLVPCKHAGQWHEGQGGCKPWGKGTAATSSSSISPWHVPCLGLVFTHQSWPLVPTSDHEAMCPFGVALGGGAHTLHTHSRIVPHVFITTHASPVRFSKPFARWLMQIAELFWQPLEAGRTQLGVFQGLRASWPWEGCKLWLRSPLSQWAIAKVSNWCHNKYSGLGKSFEVRPESRDNVLFPRLSLSHRCL